MNELHLFLSPHAAKHSSLGNPEYQTLHSIWPLHRFSSVALYDIQLLDWVDEFSGKTNEGGYKLTTHSTPSTFNCITITAEKRYFLCEYHMFPLCDLWRRSGETLLPLCDLWRRSGETLLPTKEDTNSQLYLCLSTQPKRWSSTVILHRWSSTRWSFMFGLIWKCSLPFPPFNRWDLKALSVMGDQYASIDLKTHSTLSQSKQVRPQGTDTYGDQCVCYLPNVDILTVWLGDWHWHRPHLTEFVWV